MPDFAFRPDVAAGVNPPSVDPIGAMQKALAPAEQAQKMAAMATPRPDPSAPSTPARPLTKEDFTPIFNPVGQRGQDDPRGLTPFIQQTAQKYGLDPNIAVRVAQSEGLGAREPVGDRGTSFGAFQLHTGGGLGDEFKQTTGLDPADPRNEKATIDYALRHVSRNGWGAFHGAARVGIGKWQGVR